jgi:hypothetical protein
VAAVVGTSAVRVATLRVVLVAVATAAKQVSGNPQEQQIRVAVAVAQAPPEVLAMLAVLAVPA